VHNNFEQGEAVGRKGILIVISGPSGAGKGTVNRALLSLLSDLSYSISATTRLPRNGETNGVNYYFVTGEKFQEMIAADKLLEWAKVYDNYYGTPRQAVEKMLEEGRDVVLEIDIQGALQVKEKYPDAVLIFIAPPSPAELERRLRRRGADAPQEIEKRLRSAAAEMSLAGRYDYVVVNDEVERAVSKICSIITAEKCRSQYYLNKSGGLNESTNS
jgi:guanylate kinase